MMCPPLRNGAIILEHVSEIMADTCYDKNINTPDNNNIDEKLYVILN